MADSMKSNDERDKASGDGAIKIKKNKKSAIQDNRWSYQCCGGIYKDKCSKYDKY